MTTLTFLLLLCVGLDVSNPLLPGSQRFNPDECIEVVRAERPRVAGPPDRMVLRASAERPPTRDRRHWTRTAAPAPLPVPPLVLRRRPHDRGDLATPSEDH